MAQYTGNGNDNTINGSNNDDNIAGKGGKDWLYGKGGNDYIDGGIGADFLFGGSGDDILFGNKGNDMLQGGLGADQLKGGKGIDTADYSDGTSSVLVYIESGAASGYASGDKFQNVENLVGTAFGDKLQAGNGGTSFGGGGDDTLYGASYVGTDGGLLRGDAGYDTLRMDYGNTRAWIQNGQGYDTIAYFSEDTDKLFVDLSEFGLGNSFDTNEIVNSNSGTASGTNAQFIYEDDIGYLWFDNNGTNAGGKTLIAVFDDASIVDNNLGTNDFDFQV